MKKILVAILLSVAVTPAIAGEFKMAGILFSFPDDWSITGQEELEEGTYYLSCEKDGENASGLATMVWYNDSRDLGDVIELYQRQLKNTYATQDAIPEFSETSKTTYRDFGALKVSYTVTLAGLDHRGTIYVFNACGKTIIVLTQEAIEDIEANSNGFKTIEDSFKCK